MPELEEVAQSAFGCTARLGFGFRVWGSKSSHGIYKVVQQTGMESCQSVVPGGYPLKGLALGFWDGIMSACCASPGLQLLLS